VHEFNEPVFAADFTQILVEFELRVVGFVFLPFKEIFFLGLPK
jgi:hypothetical protein